MKAILFCGGEGTRLSPLTSQIPKPMIPLQGKTVIEHLFDLFKKYGIKDIILTTCYLKEKFKEYFGNGKKFGVNILYIEEETLLGTANHIALAKQHLNETFLVSNSGGLLLCLLQPYGQRRAPAPPACVAGQRSMESDGSGQCLFRQIRLDGVRATGKQR